MTDDSARSVACDLGLKGQDLADEVNRAKNAANPMTAMEYAKLVCTIEHADTEYDLVWIGWDCWTEPVLFMERVALYCPESRDALSS